MTTWQLAMLAALPLCLGPNRFRVWAAIFASGVVGNLLSNIYVAPVLAFVVIDVLAALVILARPKGMAQHYIGCTYMAMICAHVGFIIADNPAATTVYYGLLSAAGWLAWGLLLCWGASDAGKRIGAYYGLYRPSSDRSKVARK